MFQFILLNFFFQATVAVVSPYTQILLRNKGYSHSLVGVIVALSQVACVFAPLLLSAIVDKTRKTRLMFVVLMVLCVLFFVPAALSKSIPLTIVAFLLSMGMFHSIHPISDGYQNRILDGDARRYGIARAAGTMGYVLALVMFGLLNYPDETNNRSICACFAIMALLFIIVVFFIPKDLPPQKEERDEAKTATGKRVFSRRFYLMMLVLGISRVAHAVPDKLLSSYMVEVLGLGGDFALFVSLGAFSEFVMMIIGGYLLQKNKTTPYILILLSAVALAVRLAIYRIFPSVTGLVFAQLLHSMTFGAFHIGTTKFIAQNVDKEHYSLAMSFYWAIATSLPNMLGTLFGGFVIDNLGYPNLFVIYMVFPIAAVIIALCFRKTLDVHGSKVRPL